MDSKLKLLEQVILSKKELIKDYKLIGFFGSCLKGKYFDIDLVTISQNKIHNLLRKEIKKELLKHNLKTIFFKSVKKQPVSKKKNEILIHDLHYSSLKNLIKKEWKDIINEIRMSCKVIYGSKGNIKEVKSLDEEFIEILLKWIKEIKNKYEYDKFKRYLIKSFLKIRTNHPSLKKMYKLLKGRNWKVSIKKIRIFLLENLNSSNIT